MATQRKIEITIQTDRRVVIHATGLARAWCPQCGTQQEFVTLQTAGLLTNSMLVDLTNGSLSPDLHISPSSDGSPQVCLESLRQMASRVTKLSGATMSGSGVVKGLLPEK